MPGARRTTRQGTWSGSGSWRLPRGRRHVVGLGVVVAHLATPPVLCRLAWPGREIAAGARTQAGALCSPGVKPCICRSAAAVGAVGSRRGLARAHGLLLSLGPADACPSGHRPLAPSTHVEAGWWAAPWPGPTSARGHAEVRAPPTVLVATPTSHRDPAHRPHATPLPAGLLPPGHPPTSAGS